MKKEENGFYYIYKYIYIITLKLLFCRLRDFLIR